MEIKNYKAKIIRFGNGMAVIVPSWIRKAFDVSKGDEVVVKLEKVNDTTPKPHSP